MKAPQPTADEMRERWRERARGAVGQRVRFKHDPEIRGEVVGTDDNEQNYSIVWVKWDDRASRRRVHVGDLVAEDSNSPAD